MSFLWRAMSARALPLISPRQRALRRGSPMCEHDLTLPMLLAPRLLLGVASNLGTSRRTTAPEARREGEAHPTLKVCWRRSGIDVARSDVEPAKDGSRKSMRRVLRR